MRQRQVLNLERVRKRRIEACNASRRRFQVEKRSFRDQGQQFAAKSPGFGGLVHHPIRRRGIVAVGSCLMAHGFGLWLVFSGDKKPIASAISHNNQPTAKARAHSQSHQPQAKHRESPLGELYTPDRARFAPTPVACTRIAARRCHKSCAGGGMCNSPSSSILGFSLKVVALCRPIVEAVQRKDREWGYVSNAAVTEALAAISRLGGRIAGLVRR